MVVARVLIRTEGIISKVAYLRSFGKRPLPTGCLSVLTI